jgi:hypothetical protein
MDLSTPLFRNSATDSAQGISTRFSYEVIDLSDFCVLSRAHVFVGWAAFVEI